MARINLLPWREELRKERQKNFLIALGATVALAALLIFVRDLMLNAAIENQQSRNQFLQTEINTLNAKIKEINELKSKKKELLARMEVIQNLQGNRPVIVRVFDELVRVLPDGVYFTTLSMSGNTISIQGVSESNNKISKLMRQLDESDWFDSPNLTAVKALQGGTGSSFILSVSQVAPELKEEGGS
ncbi:PilN domain-containing protein [Parendozoicomonas haliclonae]|uniref:Fimbrial assembly protein (PilN) n=1 Tax=Parendozoicomonas haliclonae TaxID=1960125 RepID=A0A1X7AFC5_9GAMM|nr:PilN domain-containing protein [Parendozoicomonas haliclonae]SMA35937.1 Fimbrial assembly protein (PilN) [Parendozoicomonas haliclonae]